MSYNIMESMVRQRLREKNGQVYCADCLAKDLEQDPSEVRAAMDVLAPRQTSRRDLARVARQDSCFAGRARRGSLSRAAHPLQACCRAPQRDGPDGDNA
jgi:hypothetical protein